MFYCVFISYIRFNQLWWQHVHHDKRSPSRWKSTKCETCFSLVVCGCNSTLMANSTIVFPAFVMPLLVWYCKFNVFRSVPYGCRWWWSIRRNGWIGAPSHEWIIRYSSQYIPYCMEITRQLFRFISTLIKQLKYLFKCGNTVTFLYLRVRWYGQSPQGRRSHCTWKWLHFSVAVHVCFYSQYVLW